ncbi:hypothetical protein BC827DRAFT_873161 [Russula dissimulans]|nr:hypothetical protein BC827DRAFT_873161 [Russula dissimulans]
MSGHHLPSIATDQALPNHESRHPGPRPCPSGTFIQTLDQDSLLHILYLCRPILLDEDVTNDIDILQGGVWTRERWWYKLAQVCRRWRHLILGSAHHLGLSLVCSPGTPVAEMLEHSPPLPLIIDHLDHSDSMTAEDEEGIMLALRHRDRVRRIRLNTPVQNTQKILMALEDEFPILEFMWIRHMAEPKTCLMLPKSLRAPHLRNLVLTSFALPIGSPLLTTAVGLVTLWLDEISPSVYFHPNDLVHRLSQLPQLETLGILFCSPVPDRNIKRELLRRPLTTHVTLPNLRWFGFKGASAYLEALLPCLTAPLLAKLQVGFFHQLTFHLPHLAQFLNTAENLRFSSARLIFWKDWFSAIVYPKEAGTCALYMDVSCRNLDWEVASAAQIFNVLRTALSTVEDLTLDYWRELSEWHNEVDRTQWRDFLRSFSNVKTLHVGVGLISQLSRSLQLEDGESPLELLPELKVLLYSHSRLFDGLFTAFIDARRIAGRPVTVLRGRTIARVQAPFIGKTR